MNTETDTKKLVELLEHFDSAMLVTKGLEEGIHARPMAIAKVDEDARVWFLTSQASVKVDEIEQDTRVHLIFQDDYTCYISLAGLATLSRDREKIKDVWKESFKSWFPDGPEDPLVSLISVKPEEAEYWDTRGAKRVHYMWEAVKAYATGARPDVKEGEQHGVLNP